MSHVETASVTFYDPQTGEILKTVQCPTGAIEGQCPEGAACIEGQYSSHEWRIVDGVPVSKNFDPASLVSDTYVDRRRNRYPASNDQLGAIMKWFDTQRTQGQPLPQELIDVLDKIQAVKATYPKVGD